MDIWFLFVLLVVVVIPFVLGARQEPAFSVSGHSDETDNEWSDGLEDGSSSLAEESRIRPVELEIIERNIEKVRENDD